MTATGNLAAAALCILTGVLVAVALALYREAA